MRKMKMLDRFKKAAMYGEFPFLQNYIDEKDPKIDEIKVKIVDGKVLDFRPYGNTSGDRELANYYLIDRHGNELATVTGGHSKPRDLKADFWDPRRWLAVFVPSENVAQTIDHLGIKAKQVFYVLKVYEWDYIEIKRMTIHKPPKKFGLLEWLDEIARRDKQEAAAAVAQIDAAGE